jgi:hypothetical protein
VAIDQRDFVVDLRNGEMVHDDDPVLNRHVGNARRRYLRIVDFETRRPLFVFAKETPNSPNHIDALTAAFLAWRARGRHRRRRADRRTSSAAAFFEAVSWVCECGQRNARKWTKCRECGAPQPELEPVG